MAKETTLNEIGAMLSHVVKSVGTVEQKMSDIERAMATKQDLTDFETKLTNKTDKLDSQLRSRQFYVTQIVAEIVCNFTPCLIERLANGREGFRPERSTIHGMKGLHLQSPAKL